MTLAYRVIIMEDGEIRQIGTPDDINDDPHNLFVAGFLGSPPMNFLSGTLRGGHFTAARQSIPTPPFADLADLQLGIRAEDIAITDVDNATIDGTVFSVEPTGEATLIVVDCSNARLVVKADKAVRPEINTRIGLSLADSGMRFFNTSTGQRVRSQT